MLVGGLADAESPARTYSPIVGAELTLGAATPATVPLDPAFEHAVLAVDGPVRVDELDVAHRQMRYLEPGRSTVDLLASRDTTLLLVGGEPFGESLVMWWNFIGRDHDEIVRARDDWESGADRFGRVDGHDGQVIPAPPLPKVRLSPRRRRS